MEDTDDKQWGTRDVADTHKLLVKVRVDEGFAYICSLEDNLGKGCREPSGLKNMNIMLGLPRLYGIDPAYSTS